MHAGRAGEGIEPADIPAYLGNGLEPGNADHQFSAAVAGVRQGMLLEFLQGEGFPQFIHRLKLCQDRAVTFLL